MDHAQGRAFHHHLARAIVHLNHLASLLPFFEPSIEWDDPMTDPQFRWDALPTHPEASTRLFPYHLHQIHQRWCHMEAFHHI